jgi:two-component system chemotaxis sensor kinase CheA
MTSFADQWSDNELVELRKVFYTQAYEIVEELQELLLRLETAPGDTDALKGVKRSVHTLKGDANSVGLPPIGALCHRIEDVLGAFLDGGREREAMEILFSAVDTVHRLLTESEQGRATPDGGEILSRIEGFFQGASEGQAAGPAPGKTPLTEYQELQVRETHQKGISVYELEAEFHPECGERSVAALVLLKRVTTSGAVIACQPDPESPEMAEAPGIWVLFSTGLDEEAVRSRSQVAGITGRISVARRRPPAADEPAEALEQELSGRNVRSELLRVEAAKVDFVMDLVGEIIIGRSMIDEIAREADGASLKGELAARLQAANSYMDRAVSDLQKSVMKMRMVPVYSVFRKFPRLVRDLALEKGKSVRVALVGNETELDKRIVDALSEPLAHLVRNAVDHGIEAPGVRRAAGKADEGVITLRAFHEASQIVIEVFDDGKGIDCAELKRRAVGQGLVSPEDAATMADSGARQLIFLPGLSTAPTVSETSGRGVGMDAVKAAMDRLKGSIAIEATPGSGTLFRLRLPLTLAIINALLFEVGTRLYAAPLPAIAEVARIMDRDLVTIEGRRTLLLKDEVVSIISLKELFGITGNGSAKKYVLILALGGRKVGLLIDRLMWQQELVIKAIDDEHLRTEYISGGSILGSGKVVLILDVQAVLRKAIEEEKNKRLVAL